MAEKRGMITFYPVEEVASPLLQRKNRWGTCALCLISISRILATLVTQSMKNISVHFVIPQRFHSLVYYHQSVHLELVYEG